MRAIMKKRWTVLIPVFLAVALAAIASAQDDTGNGDSQQDFTECSDGIDNDGDGYIDMVDPGCEDEEDDNETDPAEVEGTEGEDTEAPSADTSDVKTITYSVNPSIEVVFTENVKLTSAQMYAVNEETESMMAIGQNPPPLPIRNETTNNVVTVQPLMNLPNGLYELELVVEDRVGNKATVKKRFIINVPTTNMRITEPRLGVAKNRNKNLTINTSRNGYPEKTECKITTSPYVYSFDSDALVPFDLPLKKPSAWHRIEGFFKRADFRDSAAFYILCLDETWDRVNRERFEIYVDTTPPSITDFSFNPPKVIEYPPFENRLRVFLNITSNEPVICRYSFNESMEYEDMKAFPVFDRYDFDAYTRRNNTVKRYLPEVSPAEYDFYVQCEDRAGWRTDKIKKTLEVDLSAAIGIQVREPEKHTTNTSITLRLDTRKRAVCQAGNSTDDLHAMSSSASAQSHSYYLGEFSDGRYSYKIRCTSEAVGVLYTQEQEMDYTFVIDNTPPSAPNISGSTVTCSPEKFEFSPPISLKATDEQSQISHYLYKIETSSGLLVNWTETDRLISVIDEDYEGDDLNLSQATSYNFMAKAVNGAGVEGSETSVTIVYDPEDLACFEKDPPIVVFDKNQTEGKTVVNIYCEDESGCDNESFYYGLCDTEECSPSTKLDYPFSLDVFSNKYLAYNVSDIHGYTATGTEKIEVEEGDNCNNGVRDGEETDVDCGGSCKGCGLNQSCGVNADCESNFCMNGTCAEPTCDDGIKNGPYGNEETSTDCGGHCGATCGLNQTCNNDGDCISGFCNPDNDTCQTPTCEDGYQNGNETGVDCGGDCFTDCDDKDGDGIKDVWEDEYCGGDCDPEADPDKDGLTNIEEYRLKTDPTRGDTDGDGYSDGDEKEAGTDPLDDQDYPSSVIGMLLLIIGIVMAGGGAGYLAYKKYYLEAPKAGAAAPMSQAGAGGAAQQQQKTPQQIEEERRRAAEQQRREMERRRKAMEQRQKKLAALRQKMAEKRRKEEQKKKEQRKKIFSKFSGGEETEKEKTGEREEKKAPAGEEAKKGPVKEPSGSEGVKKISGAKEEPAQKEGTGETPTPEKPEGGWLSFNKLKDRLKGGSSKKEKRAAQGEEKQTPPPERSGKSGLESIAGSGSGGQESAEKDDIFHEMEESISEGGAAEKEEDIYKKLDEATGGNKKEKKKREGKE
ncbi:MAG: thrombospondin type 3 repeat-containing protein [Candidatus Woesearchaeota archaeon]